MNSAQWFERTKKMMPILASIALFAANSFGETSAKRDLLAEALELALNVDDDWQQPKLVAEVASRYVLKGKQTKILDVLESIEPTPRKAHAYFETASLCYEGEAKEADGLMRRATELCANIEDTSDRAELFMWIGSHYFKNKRVEAANNALVLASESVANVEKDFERAKLECEIAHQYARAGATNAFDSAQMKALKTAHSLSAGILKDAALASLAKNYAAMGRHAKYEALLAGMNNPSWNLVALEFAETQQFEAAEKTLERVTDPDDKAFAALIIVHRLADAGKWNEALALTDAIEVPKKQADSYNGLAIKKAEAGDLEQARELLVKALAAANNVTDANALDFVFQSICKGLICAQMPAKAQETAKQIKMVQIQNHAFADIAIGFAEAGEFEQALALANTIKNPIMKTRAYIGIATAQASPSPKDAMKTLELTLEENAKINYPAFNIPIMAMAADIYDNLISNQSKETL